MRVSKSDDPFTLGTLDCGYCGTKFGGVRCISTSIVTPRRPIEQRKRETELLCVSIIAAGLQANGYYDSAVSDAFDVFREIKKGTGK